LTQVTPLGVAIGIAVHSSYNGSSKAALASEGIFDSVSAGILIYNGIVDLIIPTFADRELPKAVWLQALGFAALFAGAGIMALIGKWAWWVRMALESNARSFAAFGSVGIWEPYITCGTSSAVLPSGVPANYAWFACMFKKIQVPMF
jgi:hypothetical protein